MPMTDDLVRRLLQDVRVMTEAGKLMDTLTEGDIRAIRLQLGQYIKQHKITISGVAKSLGRSPAALSQFLSGKYAGDAKKLTMDVKAWMEDDLQRRRAPNYEGFVTTNVAKTILSALHFASKTNGIALIYGPAGIGKSMTVNAYSKKHPGTILMRIRVGALRVRGMLNLLCNELNIHEYQHTDRNFTLIAEKIAHTDRMIIVDEAHRLKFDGLEAIRDIHDITECPVALIGTSNMIRQIDEGLRDTRDWITDQFSSRSCIRQDLLSAMRSGGGKLLFTEKEIFEIFDEQKLRLIPESARWLAALASTPGIGGLRRVRRVLSMCEIAYKEDAKLSVEQIKAAYEKITSGDSRPVIQEPKTHKQLKATA